MPGRPSIRITIGQGPTALAVGAGGSCLDISTLIYSFLPLSPSFWEKARYRLQYCFKGPLKKKQPTNQLNTAMTSDINGLTISTWGGRVMRWCWVKFQCRGVILIWGWSGGVKVLGKLPVPGRPTSLYDSRARAYCACSRCGWGFGHFFSHLSFLFFSPSLWKTARYRLNYCLKGPLNPK